MKVKETVYKGMDKVPEAFLGLLKGKNIGKMIVEVWLIYRYVYLIN